MDNISFTQGYTAIYALGSDICTEKSKYCVIVSSSDKSYKKIRRLHTVPWPMFVSRN